MVPGEEGVLPRWKLQTQPPSSWGLGPHDFHSSMPPYPCTIGAAQVNEQLSGRDGGCGWGLTPRFRLP